MNGTMQEEIQTGLFEKQYTSTMELLETSKASIQKKFDHNTQNIEPLQPTPKVAAEIDPIAPPPFSVHPNLPAGNFMEPEDPVGHDERDPLPNR